jgi:hypothetical protein
VFGVSDTFASALWALDTLFNLASVGVDGVNFHTLPGAGYELFTPTQASGAWYAFVHPEYYGMLMFVQAAPPGSRLLPVAAPPGPVKVWATLAPSGRIHVVLINKDPTNARSVTLQMPDAGRAALEYLQAPGLSATAGVTLGGRSFGSQTRTGALESLQSEPVNSLFGAYSFALPPASAAMLTQ